MGKPSAIRGAKSLTLCLVFVDLTNQLCTMFLRHLDSQYFSGVQVQGGADEKLPLIQIEHGCVTNPNFLRARRIELHIDPILLLSLFPSGVNALGIGVYAL